MAGRIHFVSYVQQNLINGPKMPSRLEVRHFPRRNAGEAVMWLLDGKVPWRSNPIPVGIALDQSISQQITSIALSTSARAVAISVDESSLKELKVISNDGPFVKLLNGAGQFVCKHAVVGERNSSMNSFVVVGFDFARLSVLIRKYVGVEVRGIDMGTLIAPNALAPWPPGRMVTARVDQSANPFAISRCWDIRVDMDALFLRAWISECIAERCQAELLGATAVDTNCLSRKELECLENMVAENFWLEQLRPKEVANEFASVRTRKDGQLEVLNDHYKSKIRRGQTQAIVVTTASGQEHTTRARGVKGKLTTLGKVNTSQPVVSIRTVGRQDPTNSERLADLLLLTVLQGKKTFQNSPFIRLFWFPTWKKFRPPEDTAVLKPERIDLVLRSGRLNESQERVARMAAEKERCMIVHGPPGTGKTTTIATIARIWDLHDCPVWIIAHSNVAVKNIALALHKREVGFRILVSKEFYEEWHEHLYDAIRDRLIRSDELPESPPALERMLGESCIMLSTLGMLSNPVLEERGVFKEIPVERLIVDEASQIRVFEFLHLFEKFDRLEKVFFFGDPRQLPPFNHDQVRGMKTVFDLDHLNQPQRKFLLNVQYRMPVPLGGFISTSVYQNQLNSVHSITVPSCVVFVNVPRPHGTEFKVETSWRNEGECRTVVHLVKSYYRHLEFAVVTPYDGQRGLIEATLKAENLPWENAVFNIDSFQGNERDYILISLVRTDKPGFLTSLNRLNVMLTRCKKGMVIVTNQDFLAAGGSTTLVARFASYWRNSYGHAATWVEWNSVADGSADVPGVPSLNPGKGSVSRMSAFAQGGSLISAGAPASVRVPQRYQNAAGGFDVSKLFAKAKPKVRPVPITPLERPDVKALFASLKADAHRNPFSTLPEAEYYYDEQEEYYPYPDTPPSSHSPTSSRSWDPTPDKVELPNLFRASAFPPLPSTSTEDEDRLQGSKSNGWSRPHPQGNPSGRPAMPPQTANTWASTSSLSNTQSTGTRYMNNRSLQFGSVLSSFSPPMPTLGHWATYTSQEDDIPEFDPEQFDASFTSWVNSPSTSTVNPQRPKTPPSKSTTYTAYGQASFTRTAPAVQTLVDDDGGGWTRVERRRGHGRSRGFNIGVPQGSAVTAGTRNGKVAKKKVRGYRYWMGLD